MMTPMIPSHILLVYAVFVTTSVASLFIYRWWLNKKYGQ